MLHSPPEHITLAVADAPAAAARMRALFGWQIRWEGLSLDRGYTIHLAGENAYLALSSPPPIGLEAHLRRVFRRDRVGVVVGDAAAVAERARALGYEPRRLAGTAGTRFVFDDEDGIAFEVSSYA